MKRLLLLLQLIAFFSLSILAQSNAMFDDIYISPNDAYMLDGGKILKSKKADKSNQSVVYRNGAREIVFVDKDGNRITAVSDTVYVIDGELIADSIFVEEYDVDEDGYYLQGFKGSESDFEYAERIRRFHNPRYSITIADPDYNDIYFLDDNYWNVYVDGFYATITPTWNNPYYWNYQYSPMSYGSYAWRHNWGYPYYGYGWGLGGLHSWGHPYYGGYYDPWYSGWGGYYGYGFGYGYPYYGSYYGYGWGYPHYGYGWGYPYYGNWYKAENQIDRRRQGAGRQVVDNRNLAGRGELSGGAYTRANNTTVSRQLPSATRDVRSSAVSSLRSTDRSGVNTNLRTGAVRSANEWSSVRANSERITSNSTNTISNRTNPRVGNSSSGTLNSGTRSGVNTRSMTSGTSTTTRSSSSSGTTTRSSSTYSAPSRSTTSTSSFGGGSSGTSTRSSGGSYGGGGSSRSSGGGGRR